jgi:hypothetical protein
LILFVINLKEFKEKYGIILVIALETYKRLRGYVKKIDPRFGKLSDIATIKNLSKKEGLT